jgi:hypothetical protein
LSAGFSQPGYGMLVTAESTSTPLYVGEGGVDLKLLALVFQPWISQPLAVCFGGIN